MLLTEFYKGKYGSITLQERATPNALILFTYQYKLSGVEFLYTQFVINFFPRFHIIKPDACRA